jgi:hypothetical protein
VRTVRRTAAVAVLVLAAACSTAPSDEPADPPAPGATTAPEATSPTPVDPPADGPPAADASPHDLLAFTGRQLDGGTFDGAAVTGDVVVWFWAPW